MDYFCFVSSDLVILLLSTIQPSVALHYFILFAAHVRFQLKSVTVPPDCLLCYFVLSYLYAEVAVCVYATPDEVFLVRELPC